MYHVIALGSNGYEVITTRPMSIVDARKLKKTAPDNVKALVIQEHMVAQAISQCNKLEEELNEKQG